jgi:hypothetical protein
VRSIVTPSRNFVSRRNKHHHGGARESVAVFVQEGEREMKPLFNVKRVEETATFIATELKTLLDRKSANSQMSLRLREMCPAYGKLTIGEHVLAILRALSMVELEIIADLASLTTKPSDMFDDDEDEAA